MLVSAAVELGRALSEAGCEGTATVYLDFKDFERMKYKMVTGYSLHPVDEGAHKKRVHEFEVAGIKFRRRAPDRNRG